MSATSRRSRENRPFLHDRRGIPGPGLPSGFLSAHSCRPADAQDPKASTATIEAVAYQPIPQAPSCRPNRKPKARWMTMPGGRSMRICLARLCAGRRWQSGGDGGDPTGCAGCRRICPVSDVNARKSDPKNASLFSTGGGTLLNPADPINTTDRVFRVNMTVYDRPTGHYVWRGTAQRGDANVDPATAMREMVPALLDHFGETTSGVTIPITE